MLLLLLLLLFPSASPTKRSSNRIEERTRMNFASLSSSSSHTRSESVILSLSLSLAKRYRLLRAAARVALWWAYSHDACVPRSRSLLVTWIQRWKSFSQISYLVYLQIQTHRSKKEALTEPNFEYDTQTHTCVTPYSSWQAV